MIAAGEAVRPSCRDCKIRRKKGVKRFNQVLDRTGES
jgi:hypothetical protein